MADTSAIAALLAIILVVSILVFARMVRTVKPYEVGLVILLGVV